MGMDEPYRKIDLSLENLVIAKRIYHYKKINSTQQLAISLAKSNIDHEHGTVIVADEQMEGTERTYADTLSSMGIDPINLKSQLKAGEQSQFIYPAALIHYKDRMVPVSLYPGSKIVITHEELNSAEAMMEYRFGNAINKLRTY